MQSASMQNVIGPLGSMAFVATCCFVLIASSIGQQQQVQALYFPGDLATSDDMDNDLSPTGHILELGSSGARQLDSLMAMAAAAEANDHAEQPRARGFNLGQSDWNSGDILLDGPDEEKQGHLKHLRAPRSVSSRTKARAMRLQRARSMQLQALTSKRRESASRSLGASARQGRERIISPVEPWRQASALARQRRSAGSSSSSVNRSSPAPSILPWAPSGHKAPPAPATTTAPPKEAPKCVCSNENQHTKTPSNLVVALQKQLTGDGSHDLQKFKQDGFSVGLGPLEFAVKAKHEEGESERFNADLAEQERAGVTETGASKDPSSAHAKPSKNSNDLTPTDLFNALTSKPERPKQQQHEAAGKQGSARAGDKQDKPSSSSASEPSAGAAASESTAKSAGKPQQANESATGESGGESKGPKEAAEDTARSSGQQPVPSIVQQVRQRMSGTTKRPQQQASAGQSSQAKSSSSPLTTPTLAPSEQPRQQLEAPISGNAREQSADQPATQPSGAGSTSSGQRQVDPLTSAASQLQAQVKSMGQNNDNDDNLSEAERQAMESAARQRQAQASLETPELNSLGDGEGSLDSDLAGAVQDGEDEARALESAEDGAGQLGEGAAQVASQPAASADAAASGNNQANEPNESRSSPGSGSSSGSSLSLDPSSSGSLSASSGDNNDAADRSESESGDGEGAKSLGAASDELPSAAAAASNAQDSERKLPSNADQQQRKQTPTSSPSSTPSIQQPEADNEEDQEARELPEGKSLAGDKKNLLGKLVKDKAELKKEIAIKIKDKHHHHPITTTQKPQHHNKHKHPHQHHDNHQLTISTKVPHHHHQLTISTQQPQIQHQYHYSPKPEQKYAPHHHHTTSLIINEKPAYSTLTPSAHVGLLSASSTTTKGPLYKSPQVDQLAPKCRRGFDHLIGALNKLLELIERVGQKILLDERISYITRDVLSRRLAKIRISAEQAQLSGSLGNLRALSGSARSAGLELMRLANSQVAHELDAHLRPFALKFRKIYGAYRKACNLSAHNSHE